MKQVERIQSDFTFEELNIGYEVIEGFSNKVSTITNKTSNSIEVFITASSDKGIDYKNWFDLMSFNRRFKRK